MLVDINPRPADTRLGELMATLGEPTLLTRVDQGLYEGGVNSHHMFPGVFRSDDPFDTWPRTGATDEELDEWYRVYRERVESGWPPASYGVSDSLQQVVERYPMIDEDPRPLVVIGSVIRRDAQPAYGGWRWHKWGEYIGVHEPQCEYLHDEPEIEQVWVWHIYEVEPEAVIE